LSLTGQKYKNNFYDSKEYISELDICNTFNKAIAAFLTARQAMQKAIRTAT
jgi:hypothetical protein